MNSVFISLVVTRDHHGPIHEWRQRVKEILPVKMISPK